MNHTFAQLGTRFIRNGMRLLILGLFMSLGMISHYLIGARYPTSAKFLANISLWFGCPWTLSTAVVLLGAVGMISIGCACVMLGRASTNGVAGSRERAALHLCTWALIAMFLTGYAGYFAVDAVAHGFYYLPITGPKNFWLTEQLLCVVVYIAGVFAISGGLKRIGEAVA